MKNLITIFVLGLFLVACGGKTAESTEGESQELTPEQESELANELSAEIESDAAEIKEATEENLQEVDSLLENF